MGPPLYLAALAFAFVSVTATILLCLLLAVFFAFTGVLERLFGAGAARPRS